MTNQSVTIHYLEILTPDDLRANACPDPRIRVEECTLKQSPYNRFLYQFVGDAWHWTDKSVWSEEDWRRYAESPNLRTWVAYVHGSPVGYYELNKQGGDQVEIAYFGLVPAFIGRGVGGFLLSHAIASAWGWGARRVWVHTCNMDHPQALANYQARGMRLYRSEITNQFVQETAAPLDANEG